MFKAQLIGIDIGSSAIKVVETSRHNSSKILHLGYERLHPEVVVNGAINQREQFTESLQRAIKKSKTNTTGKRAALSLGGSSVIIKKLDVDQKTNKADLADQVFYEAQQHFAEDFDNTYYTYFKMNPISNHAASCPLLLIGAKSEIIEDYISAIHDVGLKVGLIDCQVFSVYNAFEFTMGIFDSLIALINVGASSTQVSLIMGGSLLYTRDISIGGNEYSNRLSDALRMSQEQADIKKINISSGREPNTDALQNIFTELNDQLVTEIKMTLDFFFQSGEAPIEVGPLSGAFVVGGGAKTLGLDAAIAAILQVPVRLVDLLSRFDLSKTKGNFSETNNNSMIFGVGAGLAMRKFGDAE
ncbi:MAG: type IV pilus assembly protein PilM [Oligoflexales bacterium]|nr:type IV pilus assembly protein PilM [Oligoflexales bacterium]